MTLTLNSIHHVGVTVKDMQRTLDFYRETFGIEPSMRFEESGPEVDAVVDIENAHLDVAFVPIGNGWIEFIQYLNPQGQDNDRRNCDVGSTHLCFQVPDIGRAYQELSLKGIRFTSAPVRTESGPLEGWTFAYFYDLDGTTVELSESPAVLM